MMVRISASHSARACYSVVVSETFLGPPVKDQVSKDAQLAEPGSCLENRASFAISLARCEAETAAMPSPWGLLSPIFTAFSASTALAWGVSTTSSSQAARLACGSCGASSVGTPTMSDSLTGSGDIDSLAEPGVCGSSGKTRAVGACLRRTCKSAWTADGANRANVNSCCQQVRARHKLHIVHSELAHG